MNRKGYVSGSLHDLSILHGRWPKTSENKKRKVHHDLRLGSVQWGDDDSNSPRPTNPRHPILDSNTPIPQSLPCMVLG